MPRCFPPMSGPQAFGNCEDFLPRTPQRNDTRFVTSNLEATGWPQPAFAKPGWRRGLAVALGCSVIALDLTMFRDQAVAAGATRPLVGVGVLVAFLALGGGVAELGLRFRPIPSTRYWRRAIVIYCAACVVFIATAGVVCWLRDVPIRSQFAEEREILWFARSACLHAPITEELLYRLALCAPLAAPIGRFATIAVSSAVFSYLHVRWGNFEPTHAVGGAILAWAYLRSGCLWLPIVLHAIGNLFALAVDTILFYSA